MKLYKLSGVFAVISLIITACTPNKYEPVDPLSVLGKKIESTTTIRELKSTYMVSPGFFSADEIKSERQLVFNGIITSTDLEGGIYKYIVVQEEEPNGLAIRISIDASGVSSMFSLGQRVSVIANNLFIGKYGESPQIGIRGEDKGRIVPKGISLPQIKSHIIRYEMPARGAIKADTMTIAEILAADRKEMDYRLVCIKNAHFTGKGADSGKPSNITVDSLRIFAPSTNGLGFPQSREIQDGTGSLFIATSEYAKFAKKRLPASTYVGNITAIVSWYNNRDANPYPDKIYHQLTMRSIYDLGTGFEGYHSTNK